MTLSVAETQEKPQQERMAFHAGSFSYRGPRGGPHREATQSWGGLPTWSALYCISVFPASAVWTPACVSLTSLLL